MAKSKPFWIVTLLGSAAALFIFAAAAYSQFPEMDLKGGTESEGPTPVEINGDTVQFSMEENKVMAEGNVKIVRPNMTLTCDKIEYFRDSKIAIAEGHVHLTMPQGQMRGDRLNFNLGTMTGQLDQAIISAPPFYSAGKELLKVDDNHIVMKNSYVTTCDHDKPHFRLVTRKLDLYPGEKAVGRGVRLVVGKLPVAFLPKYTQMIGDKPAFTYVPGYDKDWGAFLLSAYRYRLNDDVKGYLHLDYREKKDVASGFDLNYKTRKYGTGIIRQYYMNERNITSKHVWQEKPSPTIERERFKVEWRHKVDIDKKTTAIWQYFKLSDPDILKDYFKRQHHQDTSPQTFFLLTRALDNGTFSFRTDKRVNRFAGAVERLPELQYDVYNQPIGATGFYWRNTSLYSNLSRKDASPTEVRKETQRVHNEAEISYPFKVSFIELRPFVGGSHTYYSKTIDPERYNSLRGQFKTGSDLSTKFYRVFDLNGKWFGTKINRLRHIITPNVAYRYIHDPTIDSSEFDQFDSIDTLTRDHTVTLSLENKLQTKRRKQSIDLARLLVSTDFRLKEYPGTGGFDQVRADLELKPFDRFGFSMDSTYNTHADRISSINFDMNASGDRWSWNLGKRLAVDVDDQITSDLTVRINPKWKIRWYERFDTDSGSQKAHEFNLTRDLHEWEVDFNYNETRGQGSEIWVVFRLKAFPEMELVNFGTGFNKRKAGSQSGN